MVITILGLGFIQQQVSVRCTRLDAAEGLFHLVYKDIEVFRSGIVQHSFVVRILKASGTIL